MTRERINQLQSAAKKIADYSAQLPDVCDFIGEVQKFIFNVLTELEPKEL